MCDCLIVVDMQNDFVTGVLGTPEAVAIVPNVIKKIAKYKKNGKKVIFTRDTHNDSYYLSTVEGKHLPVKHCIEGTKGHDIIPELDTTGCLIINKPIFGSIKVASTTWCADYKTVEIIGVCTGICVLSNAVVIKNTNLQCDVTVDASCCACVTPENHKMAIEVMKNLHINIINE